MHPVQATDAIRTAERQHQEYLHHADQARRNTELCQPSPLGNSLTTAASHPVLLAVTSLLLVVLLAAVSI